MQVISKPTKRVVMLFLIALLGSSSISNCIQITDVLGMTKKKDDKNKTNLILAALLLTQKKGGSESFYALTGSSSQSFAAGATTANTTTKTEWIYNADKTIQTQNTYSSGTTTAGNLSSTVVKTYEGGSLIKEAKTVVGSTAGTCFIGSYDFLEYSGSYTIVYSNSAKTMTCIPGTSTADTITMESTVEGNNSKIKVTYSITTANNYYEEYTYQNGIEKTYNKYSGTTTADVTKLSKSRETTITDTLLTVTYNSVTNGTKTKNYETKVTLDGGKVTRTLINAYNATSGALTSSNLTVYTYTNTGYTYKRYSPGAIEATESGTAADESTNTFDDRGRLIKTVFFSPVNANNTRTTTYMYDDAGRPTSKVRSNTVSTASNSFTSYQWNDTSKSITVTTYTGTIVLDETKAKTVKTITHDGLTSTNFHNFTSGETYARYAAIKIWTALLAFADYSYSGSYIMQSIENNKVFELLDNY